MSAGLTPAWLVEGQTDPPACARSGARKRRGFVEKTLDSVSELLRGTIFTESVAQRPGVLQRIDPRVKIVCLFGLLVAAAFVRHISVLLVMYFGTVGLAAASRLPIGTFVKRVWLFIPVFTGIVVLPATFSFVTPGHVVVTLWHSGGHAAGLTEQGLTSAGLVVSRVAVSISLVVLLTLTTSWADLLAGLRALFVPRIFILVIGMAYRYIFLLLNSVTDMYVSRDARTVGSGERMREGRRFISAVAGALFGKAHALSEEVHRAMVSRGYRGEPRSLAVPHVGATDAVFAAACLVAAVVVLVGDHALG